MKNLSALSLSLSLWSIGTSRVERSEPKKKNYTNSIKLGREPIIADPFNNSSAGENSIRVGIGGRTKEAE